MVDLDQIQKDIDEGRYVDFEALDEELKWELILAWIPYGLAVVMLPVLWHVLPLIGRLCGTCS